MYGRQAEEKKGKVSLSLKGLGFLAGKGEGRLLLLDLAGDLTGALSLRGDEDGGWSSTSLEET